MPCVCPEVILHPFMRNVTLVVAAGLWALINDAHIVLDPSQINQGKTQWYHFILLYSSFGLYLRALIRSRQRCPCC